MMFRLLTKKTDKDESIVTFQGELSVYADTLMAKQVIPEIMEKVAARYVEENYDEIIKLIDIEAFKTNLTIALTVQAAQKVKGSYDVQ